MCTTLGGFPQLKYSLFGHDIYQASTMVGVRHQRGILVLVYFLSYGTVTVCGGYTTMVLATAITYSRSNTCMYSAF